MKTAQTLVGILIPLMTGCSMKEPVYPHVGLLAYWNGNVVACGRFFMTETMQGPPGVGLKFTPKSLRFAVDSHEVTIGWEPDLTGSEDHYNLLITTDGVSSRRRVSFKGDPLPIIEKPFIIVMDNVDLSPSAPNKAQQSRPLNAAAVR